MKFRAAVMAECALRFMALAEMENDDVLEEVGACLNDWQIDATPSQRVFLDACKTFIGEQDETLS